MTSTNDLDAYVPPHLRIPVSPSPKSSNVPPAAHKTRQGRTEPYTHWMNEDEAISPTSPLTISRSLHSTSREQAQDKSLRPRERLGSEFSISSELDALSGTNILSPLTAGKTYEASSVHTRTQQQKMNITTTVKPPQLKPGTTTQTSNTSNNTTKPDIVPLHIQYRPSIPFSVELSDATGQLTKQNTNHSSDRLSIMEQAGASTLTPNFKRSSASQSLEGSLHSPGLGRSEACSGEFERLPTHHKGLQSSETTIPTKLTCEVLEEFNSLTISTPLDMSSISSGTVAQKVWKPHNKGNAREAVNPWILPQDKTPSLRTDSTFPKTRPKIVAPGGKVRTGDAAIWTQKTERKWSAKLPKEFPCSYEHCDYGFDNFSAMKHHKTSYHEYCKECDIDFEGFQDHLDHKIQSSAHITCPACGQDFRSIGGRDLHIRDMHPNPQDLLCPGCGTKFLRAGALVDHIEQNRCSSISRKQFERIRAVHELKHQHVASLDCDEEADEFDEQILLSETTQSNGGGVALTTDADGYTLAFPTLMSPVVTSPSKVLDHPAIDTVAPTVFESTNEVKTGDFGRSITRSTTLADPITSMEVSKELEQEDAQSMSDWIPPPIIKVPYVEADRAGNMRRMIMGEIQENPGLTYTNGEPVEAINPKSHLFDPDAFINAIGNWRCPYPGCGKSFKSRNGFVGHLESPAHKGLNLQCPECLRRFTSSCAITQHMEASGSKCQIKHTKNYGSFVSMITGGIIQVEGMHVDGSIRYEATEPEW